jgi:cytochrome c
MNRMTVALLALLTAAACEKPGFDPPDRAQRVAEADSIYDPAMFDTIHWASQEERLAFGNDVYAVECRRCHGPFGEGNTAYAREHGLEVPSLVEAGWEWADDLEAVRHRTFTGHPGGMPTLGVTVLSPREVDAVAHYVLHRLRPAAAGPGPGSR